MRLSGIAVGGPLDGTKIEAGYTWNGRIERDLTGMYRWDSMSQRWVWELRPQLAPRRGARTSRAEKA